MQRLWADNPHATLVLAGPPDPATDLTALLAMLTPTERARVTELGILDDDQKAALLGRATCLVLPSTNESFGLVVLEAWMQGTPVIAMDIPVLRETNTDGVAGLLVDPADADSIAEAIAALLDDPAATESMGRAGRAKATGRFSWAATGECLEAALWHALAHPR